MTELQENGARSGTKRWIQGLVLGITILLLLLVALNTDRHPRTDDASVRANYIQIAPEVSGRIISLPIQDNQFVKQGDVLFRIDDRDYINALRQALSDQDNLEQRIIDEQRKIAAEHHAVSAAKAASRNAATAVRTAQSGIDVSRATVNRAVATAAAAEARLKYAQNDLHRLEPLLAKQYVTVDQVDQARTSVNTAQSSYNEAMAALDEARAQEEQASLRHEAAGDVSLQSEALVGQAIKVVDTLDILISQRAAMSAKVDQARLNLSRCRVTAPFDTYVTNLDISRGQYAVTGAPIFTLIDTRTWYVIANYREGKIKRIHVGAPVELYLMGRPDRTFHGVVESVGFGVLPEDSSVVGGLPSIDRTLNWVHLSSRFPVRIRVIDPDREIFRIGASAVTVVR